MTQQPGIRPIAQTQPAPGPDATADLAAQMNLGLAEQATRYPTYTTEPDGQDIGTVLEGPEGHTNVVPEPDEAAEDATELVDDAPDVTAMTTGITPGGYFPNQSWA